MTLSIRNQLPGTITTVTAGPAMATVHVALTGGRTLVAAITADATGELGLTPGTPVRAMIKATEVALATGPIGGLSIRNQLPGTVTSVTPGAAMATVRIAVENGEELTAAITVEAASELGLVPGTPVTALVKATDVSLASTD